MPRAAAGRHPRRGGPLRAGSRCTGRICPGFRKQDATRQRRETSPRPINSPKLLQTYERQLCTYAHILEKRYGKRLERLLLYWTAEARKADALMQFLTSRSWWTRQP
jgi:hypothetical protein